MLLTRALREVVVAISTLVTVETIVVWFTRTLSTADLTDLTLCAVDMTLTWHTAWVAVVSHVTPENRATTDQYTTTITLHYITLELFRVA